jgi:RNA 2',3'-cyclic 3'-phosphodiesterase
MPRIFIAIEIDNTVRSCTEELIRIFRTADADVKWVEVQNLHLTLQFLGEVPDDLIASVCKAVEQGAARVQPFDLEVGSAGAFPNSYKPRTLWIGAKSGSPQMVNLHDNIALELAEFGFRDEERQYQTHLTIGRTRTAKNIAKLSQLLKQLAEFNAGKMHVEKAIVFSSRLECGGPIYNVLGTAHLGG